jgi:hypothetical protein
MNNISLRVAYLASSTSLSSPRFLVCSLFQYSHVRTSIFLRVSILYKLYNNPDGMSHKHICLSLAV